MTYVQDIEKVRLALISIYPGMTMIFKQLAEREGFYPYIAGNLYFNDK